MYLWHHSLISHASSESLIIFLLADSQVKNMGWCSAHGAHNVAIECLVLLVYRELHPGSIMQLQFSPVLAKRNHYIITHALSISHNNDKTSVSCDCCVRQLFIHFLDQTLHDKKRCRSPIV